MYNIQEQPESILQSLPGVSKPICLQEARLKHIIYLLCGPYIKKGSEIVRSFTIDQDDLSLLSRYAERGITLHFCLEETGDINIVAVPIGENGELYLGDPCIPVKPIVNTLEPCPSLCGCDFSENSLNCWQADDGKYYWIDPNNVSEGRMWYYKGADGNRVYVDTPKGAPVCEKDVSVSE
jgi:hypothetical protein